MATEPLSEGKKALLICVIVSFLTILLVVGVALIIVHTDPNVGQDWMLSTGIISLVLAVVSAAVVGAYYLRFGRL